MPEGRSGSSGPGMQSEQRSERGRASGLLATGRPTRRTGGRSWLNYAVQPQVMPRMLGLELYRLDINFRESAIVGIVGGGGIGAVLLTAFERYEFATAAAILLLIISIVMAVESYSSLLRRWVQ